MEKSKFEFHEKYYIAVEELPDDRKFDGYKAVIDYKLRGTMPDKNDLVLTELFKKLRFKAK